MNNIQNQKIFNLLSMAQRANKVVSGELAVEKFVQSGRAKLLLVANDVSDATRKKYTNMANFYQVNLINILSKQMLGECIGKNYRAAIALDDDGFIKALLKLIDTDKQI